MVGVLLVGRWSCSISVARGLRSRIASLDALIRDVMPQL